MTIALNPFVRRQTAESRFSHWGFSEEELVARTEAAFESAQPGYREGVLVVPVSPEGVFSSVATLSEGDTLEGRFEARREGEAPRQSFTKVGGSKMPAKACDVILYASTVLAEDGSESLDPVEGNWEIVSVNAQPVEGEAPIHWMTLLYNHFHEDGSDDGGTSTGMSPEEFEEAMRVSFNFWKDKAFVG